MTQPFDSVDRSSYPDADEAEGAHGQENAESIDPEMLVSSGFELVLPSGKLF